MSSSYANMQPGPHRIILLAGPENGRRIAWGDRLPAAIIRHGVRYRLCGQDSAGAWTYVYTPRR